MILLIFLSSALNLSQISDTEGGLEKATSSRQKDDLADVSGLDLYSLMQQR